MKKQMYALLATLLFVTAWQSGNAQTTDPRVAFVDSDSVLFALPEYEAKSREFEVYGKQLNAQLEAKQQELQTKYEAYLQEAETLGQTELQTRQRELQQLDQSLQQFNQQARTSLGKKEQLLMSPLILKVQKGIDKVAEEQGFHFVVEKSTLLYGKPEYEITQLVIQKLTSQP